MVSLSRSRRRWRRFVHVVAIGGVVGAIAFAGSWTGGVGEAAARDEPILHEPIPPNPAEDLALRVALDGDLPAAIPTPHARAGVVGAPDPLRPLEREEASYGPADAQDAFVPDKDTSQPVVREYDEPFLPSTAPFKRLEAFDSVRADYTLDVRDARLEPLATTRGATPGADEDAFYADLFVYLPPEGIVRIPSVGPGARIVRSRLGRGDEELPFRVLHDGADNWFVQATTTSGAPRAGGAGGPGLPIRARLVMEVAIQRAAFGGPSGEGGWNVLPFVAPLPANVARDAAVVRDVVGVSRAVPPRQAIARLVDYFRGFEVSADGPAARGSVYLDLALSKTGVCRHRAFAFLVTAQSLGIPTRFVKNEAHAWVEIHDGTSWKRVDLGGVGRLPLTTASRIAQRERYEPPADAFPWPRGAGRGDEILSSLGAIAPATTNAPISGASTSASRGGDGDGRPPSSVTVAVTGTTVHRGSPIHVRGDVRADGEPCAHVSVDLWLRDVGSEQRTLLGTLATGEDGVFEGDVVASRLPLGDYEVSADTRGNARCGRSQN